MDPEPPLGPGGDTLAEVDATVATQRRTALGYAGVFLLVVTAVPLLTALLPWWSEARLAGGLSPNFLTAAVGLYVFFLALGIAAASLASSIEDRMLGGPADDLGLDDLDDLDDLGPTTGPAGERRP